MSKMSKLWPYERAIAKALTIPGTKIGLSILADIQDQLSTDDFRREVTAALAVLVGDTKAIRADLDKEGIKVSGEQLSDAALDLAEALYLDSLAREFLYADFKGIEQLEKLIPLELDSIFVNLRVKGERKDTGLRREAELLADVEHADPRVRTDLEARLADRDVESLHKLKTEEQPHPIDRVLSRPGGAVLLGGPGSGKTTLVKRLARSLALGAETARQRYPDLPWCLPIVVPIALYDDQANGRPLFEFLQQRLEERGGEALKRLFVERWAAGNCLILLDGLDEVADTGRRALAARAAGELIKTLGGNRVLVTSRPVGYSLCRLSVPVEHVHLQPFERSDIETFARQWYLAYDRAVRPEGPDPEQAGKDADELIKEIQANERVESLARNPLMLTIIALIRQQNVRLPEQRVRLYDTALNTLIRSWNLARGLYRPIGRELSAEELKKALGEAACWMHAEKSTGTCHREQLQDHLVEVLTGQIGLNEVEATRTAESYIATAAEYAGLLEERGTNIFAFVHQTFQEYLAARHLAKPHSKVVERVRALLPDARWHEVIRLTAGYIGVIQEDDQMATELVKAIAENEGDRLEPYLCTGLRLAASCLADGVGVSPREADNVVIAICERLHDARFEPLRESLMDTLQSLRTYEPGSAAVAALGRLAHHEEWDCRMEAARLLSRVGETDQDARACLDRLWDDDDEDVKAHAASGLWRAGWRDDAVGKAIVVGRWSASWRDGQLEDDPAFLLLLLKLLADDSPTVRIGAAEVLGGWGPQTEALPVLLKLLEHDEAPLRYRAASVLAGWSPRAAALPALLKLLEDESASVRYRATSVLGSWGAQPEALPALLKLLRDNEAWLSYCAASVLGGWGPQPEALATLLKLLEDDEPYVRFNAASVLGGWGRHAEASATLLKLLEADDPYVRGSAAEVLGGWGYQAEALPALLTLLKADEPYSRHRAAEVLGGWGHQAEALPAVLKLLQADEAGVDYRAVDVLGGWGGAWAGAEIVLRELIPETAAAVAAYFANVSREPIPSPEIADALIRAIEPKPDDTELTAGLRKVVHHWLWQAAQSATGVRRPTQRSDVTEFFKPL